MPEQTSSPSSDSPSSENASQEDGGPRENEDSRETGGSREENGQEPHPGQSSELAPPPLSEIGQNEPSPGGGPDERSEDADSDRKTEALEDPERLRELQESLGRLEDFAAQAQAENTIRAYAADL